LKEWHRDANNLGAMAATILNRTLGILTTIQSAKGCLGSEYFNSTRELGGFLDLKPVPDRGGH